jgi:hypothetical protein
MIRAKDAWKRVAECAALAEEADDAKTRSLFAKLRDSWVQIASSCEKMEGGTIKDGAANTSESQH